MLRYRRAFSFVAPYWRSLLAVAFLGVLSTLAGLAQPYVSRWLIDDALLRHNWRALWTVSEILIGSTVLGFVLNLASRYLYVRLSASSLFDMRLAVFQHLQRLSPHYFARTKMGDIVSRINNDISEVQRICADSLLAIFNNVLVLVGSIAIMAWLNWRLFLVGSVLMPLGILAVRHYQSRLMEQTKLLRERSADIGSFLIENLLGMRVVVAANQERREVERFGRLNSSFVDALLRMQVLAFFAGAMPGSLVAISSAAVLLYGGYLVIEGHMTIGALVAFSAYHGRLLSPVQALMGIYTTLLTGAVSLDRIYEILDVPLTVTEKPDAIALPDVRGSVELQRVSFRHQADIPVLRDISFQAPAGSLCVILGPSGCGKSTIADLVARFFDPESGRVLLDGYDLRDLRLADIRNAIAVVEQTPHLFRATIRENIRYGKPGAPDGEIEACAKAAAIHDFIASLPEGYGTVIGERGATISAGERQRIALARALLRDPAVLILDEPTSALDPQSEAAIIEQLQNTLRQRTTILITHRVALADIADQVVRIDSGLATSNPVKLATAKLMPFRLASSGTPAIGRA